MTVFSGQDTAPLAITAMGFAHGPQSLTGSTSLSGGVLQFVSANQIRFGTNPGGVPPDNYGLFHRYTIRLPEPGRFLLLLAGVAALVGLGWRRRVPGPS